MISYTTKKMYLIPENERRNNLGTERLGEIDIIVKILTTSTRPKRPIEAHPNVRLFSALVEGKEGRDLVR